MAANKTTIFAMVFSIAYAVIYTIATEVNLPLVTYHPVIGEIDALWKPARSGPAMYWYGWMLTALLGAGIVAFIATYIREAWLQRVLLFGSLAAVAYLVVYSIALYVYDNASVELEFLKSRWWSVGIAIVAAAIVTYLAPTRWTERVWPGWICIVPIGALAVLGYYLTPFFTR
jgi:hypothetical protein